MAEETDKILFAIPAHLTAAIDKARQTLTRQQFVLQTVAASLGVPFSIRGRGAVKQHKPPVPPLKFPTLEAASAHAREAGKPIDAIVRGKRYRVHKSGTFKLVVE